MVRVKHYLISQHIFQHIKELCDYGRVKKILEFSNKGGRGSVTGNFPKKREHKAFNIGQNLIPYRTYRAIGEIKILEHTGPYRTIGDHTGRKGPFRTIQDHTGP